MLPIDKDNDTIAAIATSAGRAGVAIVRLSGPSALSIAQSVFRCQHELSTHVREMLYGHIHDNGKPVDEALVCYMQAPHSYTGEDVLEIQCHGGTAAASAILELVTKSKARHAEAGEFTKRAFLSGRIDLVQAESVMEIVSAENHQHLMLAERLMDGVFSERINTLLDTITECLSQLEMNINFPTQGIDGIATDKIEATLLPVFSTVNSMIASYSSGQKIRDGISVVIAGTVNAGKSSLFNAILGRKRAIVTDIPGTTRDWLGEKIEIEGLTINLIDTAGLRETDDDIEREGVKESERLVNSADIVIHLIESSDKRQHDTAYLDGHSNIIHVLSKADIASQQDYPDFWLPLSSLNGNGIDTLLNEVSQRAREITRNNSGDSILIVERHKRELTFARDALKRALDSLHTWSEEVAVLELHEAISHIESILGKTVDIDILDTIFSTFCIGK